MMYEQVNPDGSDIDPYAMSQFEQTQQASQSQDVLEVWDDTLWGVLKPVHPSHAKITLKKTKNLVTIGRASDGDAVLANLKVSYKHCVLYWDGGKNKESSVTVMDRSTNGTYINGYRVGRGKSAFLKDGSEIGFGQWSEQSSSENYKYVFRFMADGPPQDGLHQKYDVGHDLGHGSFATVKRAVCREDGRPYAIKMINRSRLRSDSDAATSVFLREIAILEKLKHQNICALKEAFQETENVILVLEYVDGGDLLDYILRHEGLSESMARHFAFQLCKALKYIHGKGIAHRDLKPENILLTRDNPPIIKLADFGLAKAMDSLTRFKTMCGTPVYLAPEVILRNSEESYSHVVDSWSTGVIVFAMIANAHPFVDDDASVISIRFRARYVDWGILDGRNVSAACREFIGCLMEENPAERMTCAQALMHPWLFPLSEDDPEALSMTPNDSFVSMQANAGSFLDEEILTPQPAPHMPLQAVQEPVQPEPQSSVGIQSVGISAEFEHIRMDDATTSLMSVPEAESEPLRSASSATPSQGRRLHRHRMEVVERDDDGQAASSLPLPSNSPAELSYVDNAHANGHGLKRKGRFDSQQDDNFEVIDRASSAEESENGTGSDGSVEPTENENGNTANGNGRLHDTNARRKTTAGLVQQRQEGADPGETPAKRTRAMPADVAA